MAIRIKGALPAAMVVGVMRLAVKCTLGEHMIGELHLHLQIGARWVALVRCPQLITSTHPGGRPRRSCHWPDRRHVALGEPIPTTIASAMANTAGPCRTTSLQPGSHTVPISPLMYSGTVFPPCSLALRPFPGTCRSCGFGPGATICPRSFLPSGPNRLAVGRCGKAYRLAISSVHCRKFHRERQGPHSRRITHGAWDST